MPIPGADQRIADAISSRYGTPVQVLRLLLVASLIASVVGSAPIAAWARMLPDSPVSEWLQVVSGRWDRSLARLGLGQPYRWLHEFVREIRPHD
ncbi:MAG TPA: hypothetical protein VHU42_13710 [Rhodopila sp.]|nr:hypothetical protein [Rhodopila sp.]